MGGAMAAVIVPVFAKSDEPAPPTRAANVGAVEAMQQARQPPWIALLNPLLGAVGVLVGANIHGRRRSAGTA